MENREKSLKRLKQFLALDNTCGFKLEEKVILENVLDKDFEYLVNFGHLELVIENSADLWDQPRQQSSGVQ